MQSTESRMGSYFLVGVIGAALGGAAVLLATEALPKMMTQMMSETMRKMAVQVGKGECSPAEM